MHARVLFAGQTVCEAARDTLVRIEDRGGDGGVIIVPASGCGVIGYHDGAQMNYGWAFGDQRVTHE